MIKGRYIYWLYRSLMIKYNENVNTEKFGRYFNKWKNIVDNMKTIENDSASLIQRTFLSLRAQNKKNNLLSKKRILSKYLLKKYNITKNKLHLYFNIWINKVCKMKINNDNLYKKNMIII